MTGLIDLEEEGRKHRRGRRVPAWVRRSILGVIVLALVGGNAWVVRRQFPPAERLKNRAYDLGLRAMTEGGDFGLAAEQFRKYLELDPETSRVHYLLGLCLLQDGKADEATRSLETALEKNPQFDEARLALAEMHRKAQDFLPALEQLRAAVAEEPTSAKVHQFFAELLVEIGDQKGAVDQYQAAVRIDHTAYECYLALGDLLMSRATLSTSIQDRQAAAAHYASAEEICKIRMNPVDEKTLRIALAKAISGQVRVLQTRSLADAVVELKKVRALDPDDPEPVLLLADFWRRMGDYREAERALATALKTWKTPAVYLALHELEKARGETSAATTALTNAIKENADDAGLRIRLVGYLAQQGRFEEAIEEGESAAVLLGDDFRVHEMLGDLALERSRAEARKAGRPTDESTRLSDEALTHYELALERRSTSLRLKKKLAGRLISGMLARGDGAEPTDAERSAREYIEQVLAVNGMDTEALAWKARFMILDGEIEQVVLALMPVLDAPDPSTDALRLLGGSALRVGREEIAARAFLVVVERLTQRRDGERRDDRAASATDWRNLVQACMAAGQVDAGRRYATDGLKAWPSDPELARLLALAHLRLQQPLPALRVLEKARGAFPDVVEIRLLLARALELTNQAGLAEQELRQALADHPGRATRSQYFAFLARTGRAAEAEEGFLELIASEPNDADTLVALGDFYVRQGEGRFEAALDQYEKARDLAPESPGPLLRIAELHLRRAPQDPTALLAAETAVEQFASTLPDDPLVDYARGKLALAQGLNEEAVTLLERYVAARKRDAAGQYYLSRALQAAGRLLDAREPMAAAVRLSPDDETFALELAKLQYDLGIEAFRRGDFEAAKNLFASAELGGAKRGAELMLAGAQASLGQYDVSEKVVRDFLGKEPDNPAAIHLLAGLLLQKGTVEGLVESEKLYRHAMEVDPGDLIARVGVGTVQYQKGLFEEALSSMRVAYSEMGGDPGVALAIAQCMARGNDGVGALNFLEGEIKAHPERDALLQIKGDFLVHYKQYDQAVNTYVKAFELNPQNYSALLAATAALAEAREYVRARRILVEQIPKATQPARLRVALADVLLALKETDQAAEELRKALVDEPDHSRALLLLGKLADQRGELADARRFYRESLKKRPWDPEPRLLLAQILVADGKTQEAIEQYEQVVRYAPRNVAALNNLAYLLGQRDLAAGPNAEGGDLDLAIMAARKASVLSEKAGVKDTLGWLLLRKGKLQEAASLLSQAAALAERDAVVQFHAGMAFARLKKASEASRYLKRALALDNSFEGADTARAELDKLR